MPRVFGSDRRDLGAGDEGASSAICTTICTSVDGAILKAAIDGVTRVLAAADDGAIPGLVAERRALREELAALQEQGDGVERLDDKRVKRGPTR